MNRTVDTQQRNLHSYRIGVIEQWPESDWKRSALASAHASLARELSYEQARCAALTEPDGTPVHSGRQWAA